jgi:hypothetical protein
VAFFDRRLPDDPREVVLFQSPSNCKNEISLTGGGFAYTRYLLAIMRPPRSAILGGWTTNNEGERVLMPHYTHALRILICRVISFLRTGTSLRRNRIGDLRDTTPGIWLARSLSLPADRGVARCEWVSASPRPSGAIEGIERMKGARPRGR